MKRNLEEDVIVKEMFDDEGIKREKTNCVDLESNMF